MLTATPRPLLPAKTSSRAVLCQVSNSIGWVILVELAILPPSHAPRPQNEGDYVSRPYLPASFFSASTTGIQRSQPRSR